MMQALQGLILGDKSYIGKELFTRLLEKGLKLITRGGFAKTGCKK